MKTLDQILKDTAAVTGVPKAEIRSASRLPGSCRARLVMVQAAYVEEHTTEALARFLARSQADVWYLIRRGKAALLKDDLFKDLFRAVTGGRVKRPRRSRTDTEREALTRSWMALSDGGMSRFRAATEVGVNVQTLWTWAAKFSLIPKAETDALERYESMVLGYNR